MNVTRMRVGHYIARAVDPLRAHFVSWKQKLIFYCGSRSRGTGTRDEFVMRCGPKIPQILKRWIFPQLKNRLYFSFQYRKILFYVASSLLLSCALMISGLLDLILLLVVEKPTLTTHSGLTTVMVSGMSMHNKCTIKSD